MTLSDLFEVDVIRAVGLAGATDEEKDRFLNMAKDEILERVLERIEEKLPEDKKGEFFRLFEDEGVSEEERTDFVNKYVPDLGEVVAEETLVLKKEAIGLAKKFGSE